MGDPFEFGMVHESDRVVGLGDVIVTAAGAPGIPERVVDVAVVDHVDVPRSLTARTRKS